MIEITIFQKSKKYIGFSSKGHAGFDEYGKDIVCAAVSALVFNAINSIDALTEDLFDVNLDEDSGSVDFHFTGTAGPESILLIDSLILGLKQIQMDHDHAYLTLKFEEV